MGFSSPFAHFGFEFTLVARLRASFDFVYYQIAALNGAVHHPYRSHGRP